MDLTGVVIVVVAFVLIGSALDQRKKANAERVRLLEEAIRNNADRHVIDALTWAVSGKQPHQARKPGGAGMAVLLAFGWITLFAGVGVWVLGELTGTRNAVAAGVLVSIIGFGLVTYPFALRELESRREPQ